MTKEEAISRIQRALNVPNRLQGLVLIDEESANMAIEALSERNIARDIATILENEQDMRVILQNADRPHGEWILVKGSNGKDYHKCSKCFHTQEVTGIKNYCAVCGAIMKGGNTE
jgi:hypothetical protein